MKHLSILKKEFDRFIEGSNAIHDDLDRDGAIQRFEYTFELVWKALKIELTQLGLDAASPREVFRLASRNGFIENPKTWFQFLELRNLASHVYREDYAKKVAESFPSFEVETRKVIVKIEEKQKD